MKIYRSIVTLHRNKIDYCKSFGRRELYDQSRYPAYFQLQAQVTREFRNFSLYLGGENLTNYKMDSPIQSAHHPWSAAFDATQVWGPVTGAMAYVGIRFKLEKL